MDLYERFPVFHVKENTSFEEELDLITETPLVIRVDGKPLFESMRTVGDETFLAVGRCFTAGIVQELDDISLVDYPVAGDKNLVDIRLLRRRDIKETGNERVSSFTYGNERYPSVSMEDLSSADDLRLSYSDLRSCLDIFSQRQLLHKKTKGAHAALLMNENLEIISFAEDVARHNALDKVIGMAFMSRRLSDVRIAVLSSRINRELLLKAISARVSLLLSFSRPTAGVVKMAKELDISIICVARGDGFLVFSGGHRLLVPGQVSTQG